MSVHSWLQQWLQDMLMWNEMPSDLVLVRHGESEGNKAKNLQDLFKDKAFAERHSSLWRLTNQGRYQANAAGLWIRNNIVPILPDEKFFRYYCSSYVRAIETAGGLGLNGQWRENFYLRERDWGFLDVMSREERDLRFPRELIHMRREKFLNAPPNGESIAGLCLRADKVNSTLSRECARKPVIMVLHGEWMWAERILLERLSSERYHELDASKNDYDKIHNCQILWYTRRNQATGKLDKRFSRMRSVCPWNEQLSSNDWTAIVRPTYSDQQLLDRAARVPQLVS